MCEVPVYVCVYYFTTAAAHLTLFIAGLWLHLDPGSDPREKCEVLTFTSNIRVDINEIIT